jgi:hypothetical protein
MIDKLCEKIGNLLYDLLPKKVTRNDTVRQDLTALAPAGNISELLREFYVKKLSICALIVVIGIALSAILWIGNVNDAVIVDNELTRNEYGEGESAYNLRVSDGESTYDISLNLSEREYTDDELKTLSEELIGIIDDKILGKNESLDRIEYDMNFASKISPYPFSIKYETDENFISTTGSLVNSELDKPQIVEIDMTLKYNDFEVTHIAYARVYSKAQKPTVEERILEQLNNEETDNRESNKLTLPDKIGDIDLTWSYKRSYSGLIGIIATPLIMLAVYFFKDKDLHKKVEERQEEMRLDYPEIVSSLALLIGAGMTVPNAWKKIAYDYRKRKEESGISRYAYEEMLVTVYEMDSGITQSVAYERFGRRCRIPSYNKLATIVSQNIKKGAVNLPMLLKEEAKEAFEDRKHLARKQGEQAGTKLLGPMMLLLVVTMVIILVPAVRTYF